jgi:hypothetical protein
VCFRNSTSPPAIGLAASIGRPGTGSRFTWSSTSRVLRPLVSARSVTWSGVSRPYDSTTIVFSHSHEGRCLLPAIEIDEPAGATRPLADDRHTHFVAGNPTVVTTARQAPWTRAAPGF